MPATADQVIVNPPPCAGAIEVILKTEVGSSGFVPAATSAALLIPSPSLSAAEAIESVALLVVLGATEAMEVLLGLSVVTVAVAVTPVGRPVTV